MKGVNWQLALPLLAAITALFTALFGYLTNRRSNTLSLYSSFVDDLHDEVTRLRSQYDTDRKDWVVREKELMDRIDGMRRELEELQVQLAQIRVDNPTILKSRPRPKRTPNA